MGFVDQVIDYEKPLALKLDQYASDNLDTYVFIARTTTNQIIIQIRDENDIIRTEGYFTETKALLDDIARSQEEIIQATKDAGYENHGSTLVELRSYRYDGTNFPKKTTPPWGDGTPPWEKTEDESRAVCSSTTSGSRA
ncbi:uncharacterized protein IL334_003240 [Kwoniella shivajii]|uniref:Uncharacterized protein n=1 Tax=Kwoniella shivajii TaxID=564305 RepID=A0ABZ1CY62_9TREE|nr:hypothetical protein IL334_003240 [Kwoniella shivajii]